MAEDIVVGKRKSKRPRWQFVLLIVAVILIAAAVGVGARWLQKRHDYSYKTQVMPQDVTAAQQLTAKGDFDKAHETINNALKDPKLSAQDKYYLLMQQGYTYEGQKDPSAAMDTYLKAEAVMQTMDVAQAIARLAADKGDKELAISYYQKALTLIPKDDPMRVEYKKYFESAISVLQTGQPKYD